MLRYIVQRLLLMIPTLLGVALLVFIMLRVMAGDPVEVMLRGEGGANVSQAMIEAERERLGLDKPIAVQFLRWIGGMATGDFGVSMWTGNPVSHEIASRLQLSLQVAIMATVFAVLISIPLGTLSALYKDSWIDQIIRVISIAGLAVPSFWLGMIIILLLLSIFHWHPPLTFTPFFEDPKANISQLIWP